MAATKRILGFDPDVSFPVEEDVVAHARKVGDRGKRAARGMGGVLRRLGGGQPGPGRAAGPAVRAAAAGGLGRRPAAVPARPKGMATRKASGETLNALAGVLPELWGGSADLAGSNNTTMKGEPSFIPPEHQTHMFPGGSYGRTLHFGIREHAMGAICNGIAVHGLTRPYGGTFLVFSDYMRPAVRLAAMMGLPVTFVWTHDSIGLGEDGPTHQPVEHLWSLRAIPGLDVVRPADANETVAAWRAILESPRPARWPVPQPAEPAGARPQYRPRAGTRGRRPGRRRGHRPGRLHPGRGRRRGSRR